MKPNITFGMQSNELHIAMASTLLPKLLDVFKSLITNESCSSRYLEGIGEGRSRQDS